MYSFPCEQVKRILFLIIGKFSTVYDHLLYSHYQLNIIILCQKWLLLHKLIGSMKFQVSASTVTQDLTDSLDC